MNIDMKKLSQQSLTSIFSIISLSALVLTGCGNGLPAGKVKATGKVLLDGQPITHSGDGLFIVNLANKNNSNTSTARFDKTDGSFEIIIEPGEYIASVTATDGFDQDDEIRGRVIPAKSFVPKKYHSLDTSDATVLVPKNGGEIVVQLISEN